MSRRIVYPLAAVLLAATIIIGCSSAPSTVEQRSSAPDQTVAAEQESMSRQMALNHKSGGAIQGLVAPTSPNYDVPLDAEKETEFMIVERSKQQQQTLRIRGESVTRGATTQPMRVGSNNLV